MFRKLFSLPTIITFTHSSCTEWGLNCCKTKYLFFLFRRMRSELYSVGCIGRIGCILYVRSSGTRMSKSTVLSNYPKFHPLTYSKTHTLTGSKTNQLKMCWPKIQVWCYFNQNWIIYKDSRKGKFGKTLLWTHMFSKRMLPQTLKTNEFKIPL